MPYNLGLNHTGLRRFNAGAPVGGTSQIWTLTFGGTIVASATCSFKITWNGFTTAAILWSATNATLVANIDAALEALSVVGTGGVTTAVATMTAGIGTITVTGAGNLGVAALPAMSVASSLEGTAPTVAVATTTAGVDATHRGADIGATLADTTNGKLYINSGTALAPTWTVVGSQS